MEGKQIHGYVWSGDSYYVLTVLFSVPYRHQ